MKLCFTISSENNIFTLKSPNKDQFDFWLDGIYLAQEMVNHSQIINSIQTNINEISTLLDKAIQSQIKFSYNQIFKEEDYSILDLIEPETAALDANDLCDSFNDNHKKKFDQDEAPFALKISKSVPRTSNFFKMSVESFDIQNNEAESKSKSPKFHNTLYIPKSPDSPKSNKRRSLPSVNELNISQTLKSFRSERFKFDSLESKAASWSSMDSSFQKNVSFAQPISSSDLRLFVSGPKKPAPSEKNPLKITMTTIDSKNHHSSPSNKISGLKTLNSSTNTF